MVSNLSAIDAHLSSGEVKSTKRLASRIKQLLPDCSTFGCSPLPVAQETIFTIMGEMGIQPSHDNVYRDERFWSLKPQIWSLPCKPSKYSNHLVYTRRPRSVEKDGRSVLDAIYGLYRFARARENHAAIAVTHGGPLDSAIMTAKALLGIKCVIPELREGEGAIFHFILGRLVAVNDFLRQQ